MTCYDDLFSVGSPAEAAGEKVQEVPLGELFPFKGHPFKVLDDEAMGEMVESVKLHGDHEQGGLIIIQVTDDHRHGVLPRQFQRMSAAVPCDQFIPSLRTGAGNTGYKHPMEEIILDKLSRI